MVVQWVKQRLQQRKELSDRLSAIREGIEMLSPYSEATTWSESQETALTQVNYFDKLLAETVKKYGISEFKDKRTRTLSHELDSLKQTLVSRKKAVPSLEQDVEELFAANNWDYEHEGAQIQIKEETPTYVTPTPEPVQEPVAVTARPSYFARTAAAAALLIAVTASTLNVGNKPLYAQEPNIPEAAVQPAPNPAENYLPPLEESIIQEKEASTPLKDFTFTPEAVVQRVREEMQHKAAEQKKHYQTNKAAYSSLFIPCYERSIAKTEAALQSPWAEKSSALKQAYQTTLSNLTATLGKMKQGLRLLE